MNSPLPLLLSALGILVSGVQAGGFRERDSAYAAAGADCRKALPLFPNDTAVEVAPSRFVCGAAFYFYSQEEIDRSAPRDSAADLEAGLRARSKSRHSLIAFGYDRRSKIEIRGDSVTVWRRYSPRFGPSEADPRSGRLSVAEVKSLESLIAAAPGGIFGTTYLIDIEADPLWISVYGKKLMVYNPGAYIWGEPLKDVGNLCRFLIDVSDRIAGKASNGDGPTAEELKGWRWNNGRERGLQNAKSPAMACSRPCITRLSTVVMLATVSG